MVFKKLSPKQTEIFKFPHESYDALICDGAVRSGKTMMMIYAFIWWAMEQFDGGIFGVCGKTVQSAERNIIQPLMATKSVTDKYLVTYTRSMKVLTVRQGKKINYFYIFGGKDESSYMLIQGLTLSGVLLDEVALMPRSFVEQAITRTLSVDNAKLWFNCNPERPTHWFYNEWIKNAEQHNVKRLHFLMTDNPGLSEKAIAKAERDFSGVFYDRYVLGLWVRAEGVIYKGFAENPQKYKIDKVPILDKIIIGVDWGGNKSGHSFTAIGITPGYGELIALCSEKHEAKDTKPEDIYKLYRKFEDKVKAKYGNAIAVYPDNAEQVLLNGLRDHTGIPVYNSYKCPVIDRIRKIQQLVGQERFLYTDDCKTLVDALCNAVWDEKKLGDERLDDGTSDIDSLDSFEYSWSWYIDYL